MEKRNFNTGITVSIGADEVIKKISKVPEWWGISFNGNSEKKDDRFVVKMGGDSFFNFTVEELVPGKKLVWSVTDCHMPWYTDKREWAGTKLIFELSEEKGETTVHFTHQGLTPEIQCYNDCELGWTHWIRTSLYSYLTTGKGQFKQRTTTKYSVSIEVTKPSHVVFDHILNDVSKFWPEELEGETSKLNDEFVFKTGESHYSKNKVTELIKDKKLVWFVTESIRKTDNFDWSGTKMIYELTPKDDHTVLTFTYDGVVLENEKARLSEICDFCIKDKLYNFIESFSATIEVGKSPGEVFECITEVRKWWSEDFEGSSTQLNDEFIIHHPDQHYSKQNLIEVIPGRKMVWLVEDSTLYWLEHDKHDWTNTKMIFEIKTSGNKTILHFTHEGLTPKKESYATCEKGWAMVIKDWLLHYITHGTSSPEMSKVAEIRNQILAENT